MIETERLRLRNWRQGDGEQFREHCNRPNVMRWLGGVRTPEFMDEVVGRFVAWQEERGFTFWVVERKEDCAFLGFCGLKIADGVNSTVAGEIEVGWRFREDAWGKGYAKEAAIASLDHAFDKLAAPRVVALTVVGNEMSWGLMKRLGMTLRPELEYVDLAWPDSMNPTIVYVITRQEWEGRDADLRR
jgi:RimJ/RimL family protein N-acetyltransferase